jgi:hypothetical protein
MLCLVYTVAHLLDCNTLTHCFSAERIAKFIESNLELPPRDVPGHTEVQQDQYVLAVAKLVEEELNGF